MPTIINLDEYRISKAFVSEVLDRCHRCQVSEATTVSTIGAVMRANHRTYLFTPKFRVTCHGNIITLCARGRRRYGG